MQRDGSLPTEDPDAGKERPARRDVPRRERPARRDDPFATFTEWDSEADRVGYADF